MAKISLILVYFVILAGAIVRMTGSGMGCPDWPKCFGYYVPPTSQDQLEWKSMKTFDAGQIIIRDESLLLAKENFTTSSEFKNENWKPYTKHEYATFNPWHTWIEYINRLVTVLLGIPVLIMACISFFLFKENKSLTFGALLAVLAIGIEAILGKIVVDTNLKTGMITIHMVIAFLIAVILIFLVYQSLEKRTEKRFDLLTYNLMWLTVSLTLFQVILGTQVREFVDVQIDEMGYVKDLWLQNPNIQFYIHRTCSIVVVALNLFLAYRIYKLDLGYSKIRWVLLLILLEIISGMAMYYFNFPFSSQPIHLVLAALLFGFQFRILLEAINSKNSYKSL
jgi:cytochrome c oxidase assembly protein subunit 15